MRDEVRDAVWAAESLGLDREYPRYELLYAYVRYYPCATIPGRLATAPS